MRRSNEDLSGRCCSKSLYTNLFYTYIRWIVFDRVRGPTPSIVDPLTAW